MPGEDAPEHRHTQHAFRFVVEGEGVWTVVNGDAVRMSRGDFLPQAGWNWHAHHNAATEPMAWIDGLDIPFSYYTESQFFEVGRERIGAGREDDARSLALRAAVGPPRAAPGVAARCNDGHAAAGLSLGRHRSGARRAARARGRRPCGDAEPGHAAVRFTNPTTGGDVLPTIRTEMHRVRAGAQTLKRREVGSSVYQVFDGAGTVMVGDTQLERRSRRPVRRAVVGAVRGEGVRCSESRSLPLRRRADLRGAACPSDAG